MEEQIEIKKIENAFVVAVKVDDNWIAKVGDSQMIAEAFGVAQVDYLRSSPLHKSQSEGKSKYGEFAEFTYRVSITPELISQLLAIGDRVEVLEPVELREEMKKMLIDSLSRYK